MKPANATRRAGDVGAVRLECGCYSLNPLQPRVIKLCALHGAAPELLAACDAALSWFDTPTRPVFVDDEEVVMILRAAIAKAGFAS